MNLEKVPRVVQGIDIRSLPISSKEAYVLSCLDSVMSVLELVSVTGNTEQEVMAMLSHLQDLGAIEWVDPPPPVSLRPPRLTAPPSAASTTKKVEAEEHVDMDSARAKAILDMYARLDLLSYYDLLGVDKHADRKTIRNAYFKLSKVFHPDSMYGKNIGSYKVKMEKIFTQLTKAYDMLSKKQLREEYDAYLKTREDTDTARVLLEKADVEEKADTEPPSGSGDDEEKNALEATQQKEAAKARYRKFAAQKLFSAIGRSSTPPKPGAPKADRQEHAKTLARNLMTSVTGSSAVRTGLGRSAQFLKGAKDAERAGDLSAAMNAMRLAKAMAPDNPDIGKEYERMRKLVAQKLVADYIAQARYEERFRMWEAAANSWVKVTKAKPDDAEAYHRAAAAMLQAKGDMRHAQRLAKKRSVWLRNQLEIG
ncbi:MAG: J domain-containing protein [Myxococcales bacterium]|nr:MAG: J domain-containing protein [Myxococcales bacterium]